MLANSDKILIVILGETRASHLTWPSFKTFALNPLKADLALCVFEKVPENEFYKHAQYIWNYNGTKLEDMIPKGVDWKGIFSVPNQFMGGLEDSPHPGSAGILLFLRHYLWKMLQQVLGKYDWFLITRSDYYYLAPLAPPRSCNQNNQAGPCIGPIYIVEGEDYGGLCDRHIILPRSQVHVWLDFIQTLINDPKRVEKRLLELGNNWNLEKILKWRLKENGVLRHVVRTPQVMFTVRDGSVKTRWSSGEWNEEFQMYVKYPRELERAKNHFANSQRSEK